MSKTATRRPKARDPETANLFETAALLWDGASTSAGGDATTDVGGLPGGKGVAEGVGGCGGGVAFGDGA
jgi:hypothetical protein